MAIFHTSSLAPWQCVQTPEWLDLRVPVPCGNEMLPKAKELEIDFEGSVVVPEAGASSAKGRMRCRRTIHFCTACLCQSPELK
jgi:hypothetical protein